MMTLSYIYLISSKDDGATFGNAVRLGNSAWMLNACPMDGGMLAIDKDQQIATTWRRDRSINQAMALPGTEIPIGIGEQPWIASGTDGFYTVWTSKRDGEMLLMKPKSTEPKRLDENQVQLRPQNPRFMLFGNSDLIKALHSLDNASTSTANYSSLI